MFKSAMLMLWICIPVLAGEVSDTVTFRTAEPAPSGFESWTFHWTMPEIDPDATLEYTVLQTDGEEYFHYTIPDAVLPGHGVRSDFSLDLNGAAPEVFYGNEIQFVFTVDRGTIVFPEYASFQFEFDIMTDAVR